MMTEIVQVGKIKIGGNEPLTIQSMTNVAVADIESSVLQCKQLFDAGAKLVRLSVPRNSDVECLAKVKKQLVSTGYDLPIVADVHFSSDIALECAKIVEKVRINPGNYIDKRANFKTQALSESEYKLEIEKMYYRLLPLINTCKTHGTALRIGSNHGSLSDRILTKYGNSAVGMVEAAMEFINIFASENFHQLVISMKASNVSVMTDACVLLDKRMRETGRIYPQHLGVTEAGSGMAARIKSTLGLAYLLKNNIGSTIRVSLTESPVNEIFFAKKIVEELKYQSEYANRITKQGEALTYNLKNTDVERAIIEICLALSNELLLKQVSDLEIVSDNTSLNCEDLSSEIMQAAGIKISKAEFISCPGCGRTNYNLEAVSEAVKREFSHLKGLKIATMGCIVNGPGEMSDADYGCVGSSKDHVIIYKKQEPVLRDIPQEKAVEMLKKVISENGDWHNAEK